MQLRMLLLLLLLLLQKWLLGAKGQTFHMLHQHHVVTCRHSSHAR
jgi:hypothetical protein